MRRADALAYRARGSGYPPHTSDRPRSAFRSAIRRWLRPTFSNHELVTSETSPAPSQSINLHTFQVLGGITPLVLLPSERLPGAFSGTYNRTTLAVRFSLQVRVEHGRAKFVRPREGSVKGTLPEYAKAPATRIHAEGHYGDRDLLCSDAIHVGG